MEYIVWYSVTATFAAIALAWFYWKFVRVLDYWKKKGAIHLKPIPLFGNVKNSILMRVHEAEMYQKLYWDLQGMPYGGVFHMNQPCLLIRDPELIKDVLVKRFAHFHDRGFIVDEKNSPLFAHLFQLGGKTWRNLRIKLTPTFTSGKIKMMFPIFTECAEQMLKKLQIPAQKEQTIEMKEIVSQLTTDVIGSCIFGLQINSMSNEDADFRVFARKLLAPSLSLKIRFLSLKFFPPLVHLANLLGGTDLLDFFMNAIKDMVKYREENHVTRKDFLQLLIDLKNQGRVENDVAHSMDDDYLVKNLILSSTDEDNAQKFELTDNLLAAQCFVFFLAGFETSSSTASYCLHELAQNPDIQEKLRDEIDSVTNNNGGKITYDSVQKMKYLEQVVDETLRKYPPIGKLDRICTKPYTIPGTDVIVDKGVHLAIPVLAIHHDPKYYPDPEKFDPDRFTPENKSSRPAFTYLPFGEGPRICIGMRFGLIQTKMALVHLLSKYKFSVCEKTSHPIEFAAKSPLILVAKGGIWLKINKRDLITMNC